jgi:exonuclease III
MKIITWNCNGALRKKTALLDPLDADLLVIQECEDPASSTMAYQKWAGNYLWHGDSRHRGIGVFARKTTSLEALDWSGEFKIPGIDSDSSSLGWKADQLKSLLPCLVNQTTKLLAVWTKQAGSPTFGYMGQFWKYLQINKHRLEGDNVIVCGDFNSNAIWDRSDRWWNHSDVVRELADINIHSLYHHHAQMDQGDEADATFFMQRNRKKGYHIDYAFVSNNLVADSSISVGNPDDWLVDSDHMPLTFLLGEADIQ